MNLTERRAIDQAVANTKLETREDGSTVISGYAAVFYRADDPGTEFALFDDLIERIMPGAFDRAIREDDVRALFNHDSHFVLGRSKSSTLELSVDKVGLRYNFTCPDTSAGRDVAEMIRRGDVDGSSFSFRAETVLWREEGDVMIRELEAVELFDVGPVTWPAYQATTTEVAQRSLDEYRNLKLVGPTTRIRRRRRALSLRE